MRDKILIGFYVLVALFLCFMIYQSCEKQEKVKIKYKEKIIRDSIYETDTVIKNIVKERIKIKLKLDTLNKIIYVPREVIVKDSVLCDSLYSLAMVQKKMISNDSNLIAKQGLQINNYQKLDTNWQCRYDSLSVEYDKASKKYYWKGFKHGFYTGNATGFTGSLLIKKAE